MRLRMEERLERQGHGGTPPPKRIRFEPDDNSYCDEFMAPAPPRKIGRVETEFQPQLDGFWTMHPGTSTAGATALATTPIPNFESAFAPAVRQDSYDAFMRRLYGTTSSSTVAAAAVASESGTRMSTDRRTGESDPGNISLDSGYDEDGSSGTSTASTTLSGELADETFALPNIEEVEEEGDEEEEDEEPTVTDALGDVLAQSIISDTI